MKVKNHRKMFQIKVEDGVGTSSNYQGKLKTQRTREMRAVRKNFYKKQLQIEERNVEEKKRSNNLMEKNY